MPFIGQTPVTGAYQLLDSITTSATTTFALTIDGVAYTPASAQNLIVSLNGVTQAPQTAYTIEDSNIVFATALTTSDVIDYIMALGDVLDVGTISDGTVTNSKLQNYSVTSVKMSNSGATAASYGSASEIPVITIDAAGRITAANTTAVAGVANTYWYQSNNTFSIETGDGSTFDTTIDTFDNIANINYIDFFANAYPTTHPPHKEGKVFYDSIHKTLNYYSDVTNVIHELGIEEHQRVFNNTGNTILKGKPLYFSGNYTSGVIDVPTVGLADATDVNAYNAQGLAAADIPNNAYGYCIIAGQIDGVDTSALNAGTNFFVGLTPGAVQNQSPLYPNYPMCLGWVVNSSNTDGVLLVNQQNHSVNSFRVRTSAHIGTDLQVDGNLTVLGTTTAVSTEDVTAGASMFRLNEGDSIGEAGTTFTGSGLDDAFFSGHFTGTTSTTYYLKIDGVGTGPGGVDTFAISTDNFVTTITSGNAITGSKQLIHSADNIYVEFGATTGHTLNDLWSGTASPIDIDTGFWSNRNTGTSGVGYTHMGLFYDTSDDKWKFVDQYRPTPEGIIDTANSTFALANVVAHQLEANVIGSISGGTVSGSNGTFSNILTAGSNVGIGVAGGSIDGMLHLKSTGPVIVTLEADTDNAIETDNPRIVFKQDGAAVIGRVGYANNLNDFEVWNEYAGGIYFGTSNNNRMFVAANGNVGVATTSPTYNLEVNGSFAASTKSFDIEHPTKPNMRLKHGSLEGPEFGVYARGKLEDTNIIELPDYWIGLVDEETITVNLTPFGQYNELWVDKIENNKIYINSTYSIKCFYIVYAERKDIDKLVVEY